VEPKTVRGILRHSRIQTTLDLYTQQDAEEMRAVQRAFLKPLRERSEAARSNVGWIVGWDLRRESPILSENIGARLDSNQRPLPCHGCKT
jgi:hypothetical protein